MLLKQKPHQAPGKEPQTFQSFRLGESSHGLPGKGEHGA